MEVPSFESVHDEAYRQSRREPPLGHPHYIHLSDLLLGLQEVAAGVQGRWLDYGSGASPYRCLFGDCEYLRADLQGADLDYQIRPGQPLEAPAASFDGILSTQVLEHVKAADGYLDDSYRLLKPGGTLILSTHGTWKEHGVPHDYWRWTEWGLRSMLTEAGFTVQRLARLSSGPRAVLNLLFTGQNLKFALAGHGLRAYSLDRCFQWIARHKKLIHRLSDHVHQHHRVVWDRPESFYLVLLVVAEKPASTA